MFNVQMFGPLVVDCNGRQLAGRDFGGVKPKHLFEVLLLNRNRAVSKDELADALWGDRLPRDQVATLEAYVSVLRNKLQPGAGRRDSIIVTEPGAYRLDTSRVSVDLDEFDRLIAHARTAERLAARRALVQACDLVHGEVLEDRRYADCVQPVRDHYRLEHVDALVSAAELCLTDPQEASNALRLAERSLLIDPLNEAAYRIIMKAAVAIGRRDIALRAFDRCVNMLASELDVEPSIETTTLRDAIIADRGPQPRAARSSGSSAPPAVAATWLASSAAASPRDLAGDAAVVPLASHTCLRRRSMATARPRHSLQSRRWPRTGT